MKYLDGHPRRIKSSRSASGEAAIRESWKRLPAGHHVPRHHDILMLLLCGGDKSTKVRDMERARKLAKEC